MPSTPPITNDVPALRLLVLGGTKFVGPAVVEAAIARGHTVTLFNRGRSGAEVFPDVEQLRGDRDPNVGTGLDVIRNAIGRGRRWDAVIDVAGMFPRIVGASASLLAEATDHYLFVSSISVYADRSVPGIDENAPLDTMPDETIEDFGPAYEYYGPLKVLCERAAERAMPGRVTVVRPGLIVGPRDDTDRWTYWSVRIAQGGEVLAPGDGDDPVQFIDVRDLGAFMLTCVEQRVTGVFNATGPVEPITMGALLETCIAVTGSDARLTWIPADVLEAEEVRFWRDLPAWVPRNGDRAGFMRIDSSRAIAAGLRTRPPADTIRATLEWFEAQPARRRRTLAPDAKRTDTDDPRRAGIDAARERRVLNACAAGKE